MTQKIAVITGATGALGGAIACGLAARDPGQWHIVALGKSKRKLEQLDDDLGKLNTTATLVQFDFTTDLAPLAQLGAQLHERFGKVDALIMAAAMLGPLMPLHHLDTSTLTRLLQVNVTAHHALLRSLDPLLRAAPTATATFITCSMGADVNAYWGGYRAGKDAFAALGRSYAAETINSTIKTILFEPGAFASTLRRDAFPGIAPESLPTAEQAAAPLLEQL